MSYTRLSLCPRYTSHSHTITQSHHTMFFLFVCFFLEIRLQSKQHRLSLALNSLTVAVPPQHAMKVTEVFEGDSVMVYGSDAPLGRGPGQALR